MASRIEIKPQPELEGEALVTEIAYLKFVVANTKNTAERKIAEARFQAAKTIAETCARIHELEDKLAESDYKKQTAKKKEKKITDYVEEEAPKKKPSKPAPSKKGSVFVEDAASEEAPRKKRNRVEEDTEEEEEAEDDNNNVEDYLFS